ncbi:SDR family oxidoreductase [Micromonospora sp. C95]|nr:SDR family oxidoreductase [Micromonospora sp. C95]
MRRRQHPTHRRADRPAEQPDPGVRRSPRRARHGRHRRLSQADVLRGRDGTVNAVAPGPTATPLFLQGEDEETVQRMARMNPSERLGTPEGAAEVVSFLAGPGRRVNGQVICASGGAA